MRIIFMRCIVLGMIMSGCNNRQVAPQAGSVDGGVETDFTKDTIVFTAENPRDVPPYFFGVAHSHVFEIHRDRMEYTNDSLLPYKREMRIQHERGPCGTGANFFLWRKGVAMTSRNPDYASFFGETRIKMVDSSEEEVPIPLTREILFRDVDALSIPYVYCLNVFTDSDDEIVASAADIKKRMGNRPVFLELGNEVYGIAFKKRFPSVEDYVAFVKRIAPKLRAAVAGVKLSVVGFSPVMYAEMGLERGSGRVAEQSELDYERTQAGRIERWNEKLAQASASFDAVSIHYYNRIRSFDKLPTADHAMAHLFAGNRYYFEKMCSLGTVFPGKELWATEWNVFNVKMLEVKTDDEKSKYNISKYSGTAVVLASLELNMLFTGLYTMSSPHELYAANGFGFINFQDREHRDSKVKLPQFYTRQALGIILEKYHAMHSMRAPSADKYSVAWELEPTNALVRHPLVEAYGFGDASLRVVVFINTTKERQAVSVRDHAIRRIWSYGEADPFPDYLQEKRYHWTSAPDNIPVPRSFREQFRDEIALEPYCMTIVEVDSPADLPFASKPQE